MILRQEQILNVLRQISKNILLYITANLGEAVLSEADHTLLDSFGISTKAFEGSMPPYYKMFLLGRLTQVLGDYNSSRLSYDDFDMFIQKEQYQPLTSFEEIQYMLARQATYSHLKNLDNRIRTDVETGITSTLTRTEYESIVKEEIESGVKNRKAIGSIISDIGHRTGDWKKDLGRIVDTEMNNIFQQGRAMEIAKKYPGQDPKVYKDVYEGACRHCISLYLTGGLGSAPRVFTLSELAANGTNIGRNVKDWRAVIGTMHPWCRCTLRSLPNDMIWSKEKKQFVYDDEAIRRKDASSKVHGKIRVTVNDKEYVIEL
jgi:hypothetical protein